MDADLRRVYERRAELSYAEPARLASVDRKFHVLLATIARYLPCEAFLDAGCGDGRYLAALPSLGPVPATVLGTDLSERILETARAAVAETGVVAELRQGPLEQLPLPDGAADLVLCSQVIEHLLEPAEGARELARVLRPGGVLILTTDNARNLVTKVLNAPRRLVVALLRARGRRQAVHFPHRDFTSREVEALLAGAGLRLESMSTFRFTVMNAPAWVQRILNVLDERLPDVGAGDILVAVARRPPA